MAFLLPAAAGAAGATSTLSTIGTVLSVAGTVMSFFQQRQQAKYESQRAAYDAAVARNNAIIAGYQAEDALKRGQLEEKQHRLKVAQLKGQQRAALAANGVLVDSGSALDIVSDTAQQGELDALVIRSNAQKQAWGYRVQAANFRSQAVAHDFESDAALSLGNQRAFASLLTGAGTVAKQWYQYKRAS